MCDCPSGCGIEYACICYDVNFIKRGKLRYYDGNNAKLLIHTHKALLFEPICDLMLVLIDQHGLSFPPE